MAKIKRLTNKELTNAIMNNFNNLNLLANYINDFIEYKNETSDFKKFIVDKYERIVKDHGQTNNSNTDGDRKDQPGDTPADTKSSEVRRKPKAPTNKTKTK